MKTMLETALHALARGDQPIGRRNEAGKVAEPVAGDEELRHDLARREVAHEPLRAGVAEGAGQRAADLARDAERPAVRFGDIDAFDLGAAVVRAGRLRSGSATCECRRSTPARRSPRAATSV